MLRYLVAYFCCIFVFLVTFLLFVKEFHTVEEFHQASVNDPLEKLPEGGKKADGTIIGSNCSILSRLWKHYPHRFFPSPGDVSVI